MSDLHDEEMREMFAGLPERDVDRWRSERIRARAKAIMRREASPASRWLDRLERIYGKTLEPAIVFGAGTTYLVLAIRSVMALFS